MRVLRMARGLNGKNSRPNKFTSKKNRKFSFNNGKNKRKYDSDKSDEDESLKKTKIAKKHEEIFKKNVSSSESEEDNVENPLTQLLNTFDSDKVIHSKVNSAFETDDSSDDSNDELDENNSDSDETNEETEELTDTQTSKVQNTQSNNEFQFIDEISELVDENEEDLELLKEEMNVTTKDPFVQHFCYDLQDSFADSLQGHGQNEIKNLNWPLLGKLNIGIPTFKDESSKSVASFTIAEDKPCTATGTVPNRIHPSQMNLNELHIKPQVQSNIKSANTELIDGEDQGPFTEMQSELFSILNNYQDFYYNERTLENADEICFIYCLHALNHVLKTRTKVLHHNARLAKRDDVPEEFRDQGLVRPKVLIMVPFRNCALKIVQNFIKLLVPAEAGQVINKLRFVEDFSGHQLQMPKKKPKPEDYELTFAGNSDDNFKIGIQITKKSLKLYSDFYSSDIIIASPLGLRLTLGAKGEADRDHDFLASIEMLVLDHAEVFLMQNWDHLLHMFDHLHVQPKHAHGTDFSRVRTWSLNGWARYYRQSLFFSSVSFADLNAVFNRRCVNYAGAIRLANPVSTGSIVNVVVQVPQVYRRVEMLSGGALNAIETRFDYFVNKVLSQYKDTIMKQCLIYVPTYYDFVRVRNHFKKEELSFVQICEYSKSSKVARARDMFFHGDAHFLIYSERFHFFNRIRLKGIRHIIFYQLPTLPHFYSEVCNFMQEANQNKKVGSGSNMSVTVIYSKYDANQMALILGSERLAKIASSANNFHMFTSSSDS